MSRYQTGWLRVVERKQGPAWQLRYNVINLVSGKRKEQTKIVGSLADFPTESACWREADRQRLCEQINQSQATAKLTFRQIADFYLKHNVFTRLATTTQYTYRLIINKYLKARWGECYAIDLETLEIEQWLMAISKEETEGGLDWPTIGKIKYVMALVYRTGEKYKRLPKGTAETVMGSVDIPTQSSYKAIILGMAEVKLILDKLGPLERAITVLATTTGLRFSEMAGLQWRDLDYTANLIRLRRTWKDGKISEQLKTTKSKSDVAMSEGLAACLREWQCQTLYSQPAHWVFASERMKGRTPRVGNMLARDHLRGNAIKLGILKQGKDGGIFYKGTRVTRFGFHNLRHGLSTFLIANTKGGTVDVRTAQDTLRHAKSNLTIEGYTQSSHEQRVAAQELVFAELGKPPTRAA